MAKGVDLTNLDFVVLSHRHSDHMAGLSHVLSVNPRVKIYAPREGFGIYGSSLPSSFYRKDESLPAEMRYYDGKPPEVMKFGTAWQGANFETIDKTTEVAPGVTLIALVSDAPGTRELRELSLAVNTPDGVVLVVGCSHPGIDKIVEAAAAVNPKIHLIAGGFHLVVAPDDVIAKAVAALKDTFKVENVAPGHCTGEPTFAALKQAFGDRYIYAGSAPHYGWGRARAPASDVANDRHSKTTTSPPIVSSPAARTRSASAHEVRNDTSWLMKTRPQCPRHLLGHSRQCTIAAEVGGRADLPANAATKFRRARHCVPSQRR